MWQSSNPAYFLNTSYSIDIYWINTVKWLFIKLIKAVGC